MKKEISLSENQLRNTIKQTIAESLLESQPLFYVEDEGSGEICYTTSDLEDAKSWIAGNHNGCYIITDNNGDEIWRNKEGISYKFESINEGQIACAIRKVISEELTEDLIDRFYKAHIPSDEEIPDPTVKDVIERNGWLIKSSKVVNNGILFQIEQKTGLFGNTEGTLGLNELLNDIKIFGKNGKIIRRERQFADNMTDAEKAIIYIQN